MFNNIQMKNLRLMKKLVDHNDYEDDIQSCLGKKNDFTNYVLVQKSVHY
jgi:hypothetical protein